MKFHQFFFCLLIILLPLQLGKHFWPDFSLVLGLKIDYLSPTLYLTDVFVVGLTLSWLVENGKNLKSAKIFRYNFLIAFFLLLLVNIFFASSKEIAIFRYLRIMEAGLLALYVSNNFLFAKKIITSLLPATLVYEFILVIWQFYNQSSIGGFFYLLGERSFTSGTPGIALGDFFGRLFLRPYGTFSHPNSLAGYFLVSVIIFLGLWQKNKITKTLLILICSVVLILSFSESVWLASTLALVFYFVFNTKIKPRFKYFLYTLILLILLVQIFFQSNNNLLSQPTLQERLVLNKAAFQMSLANPIFGVGLNNFIYTLPDFLKESKIYLFQPVHNLYLLILSETGFMIFFIFLFFLILSFKYSLERKNKSLFIALAVIILTGLFDHYWLTLQQNLFLASIVIGLIWSKIEI